MAARAVSYRTVRGFSADASRASAGSAVSVEFADRNSAATAGDARVLAQARADVLRALDLSAQVAGAVSVIMPLYNGAQYVEGAVRSVIDQGFTPLELIIVDDGSTDGSAQLVANLDAPFPIVVVRQDNAGQGAARNAGITRAHGEFFALIDQDDLWRTNHLDVVMAHLVAGADVAMAFTDFDQMDANGQTITRQFMAATGVEYPKRSLIEVVSRDLMALPTASGFRRAAVAAVGGFDPRLIGYEDDDLFVKLYRAGWVHVFDPRSTVRYRTHPLGASSTGVFLQSRLIFLRTLLDSVPDDHRLDQYLSRDYIVPRFHEATLLDYADALAFRDWPRALLAADALDTITAMSGSATRRRRLGLRMLRRPQVMRTAILLLERLPRWLTDKSLNPALRIGHRSVVRAGL